MRILLCVVLVALAGCNRLPTQNWAESIERATTAWNAADYKKALALCQRGFDQALEAKTPAKAILAHECEAEAAWRLDKPELSFANLDVVLARHETLLASEPGAIRLRLNRGVALIAAGKKDEGLKALEEALDAYEDTPHHSRNHFRIRMLLVNNMLRVVVTDPESPLAVRLSSLMLDEIEQRIERDTRIKAETPPGYAEAMRLIAKIVIARGDVVAGKELAERAKELKAEEDEIVAAAKILSPICHSIPVRLMVVVSCFREVPPYLEPIPVPK